MNWEKNVWWIAIAVFAVILFAPQIGLQSIGGNTQGRTCVDCITIHKWEEQYSTLPSYWSRSNVWQRDYEGDALKDNCVANMPNGWLELRVGDAYDKNFNQYSSLNDCELATNTHYCMFIDAVESGFGGEGAGTGGAGYVVYKDKDSDWQGHGYTAYRPRQDPACIDDVKQFAAEAGVNITVIETVVQNQTVIKYITINETLYVCQNGTAQTQMCTDEPNGGTIIIGGGVPTWAYLAAALAALFLILLMMKKRR